MSNGDSITWETVVALLAQERTRAVTAAGLLKKYGSAVEIDRLGLVYGEAKAKFDGLIAGLTVALAQRHDPGALQTLAEDLEAGLDARQTFSDDVSRLLPPTLTGRRTKDNLLADAFEGVAKGVVGPIVEGIVGIWTRLRDEKAVTRKIIETKLEAAVWPDYSDIQ